MSQTALIIIILVVLSLAYARGQVTNAPGKQASATTLMSGKMYAALLAVAAILAVLWH